MPLERAEDQCASPLSRRRDDTARACSRAVIPVSRRIAVKRSAVRLRSRIITLPFSARRTVARFVAKAEETCTHRPRDHFFFPLAFTLPPLLRHTLLRIRKCVNSSSPPPSSSPVRKLAGSTRLDVFFESKRRGGVLRDFSENFATQPQRTNERTNDVSRFSETVERVKSDVWRCRRRADTQPFGNCPELTISSVEEGRTAAAIPNCLRGGLPRAGRRIARARGQCIGGAATRCSCAGYLVEACAPSNG